MDVLVDLDGTLIDPLQGIIGSFQFALEQLGHPVPPAEELRWVVGPPLRVSFPRLLGSSGRTEEAVAFYRQHYLGGAMYEAEVYAGITEALDALATAGARLFVATAKPHDYARPILEHFDLTRHFAGIHGPELDGTRDQKAELIAHIIASEGVRPETAVMVGDRAFDVTAAARNGIPTVGVAWGYGSVEELETAGAATLCRSPASLAATVRSLAQR